MQIETEFDVGSRVELDGEYGTVHGIEIHVGTDAVSIRYLVWFDNDSHLDDLPEDHLEKVIQQSSKPESPA